VPTASIDRASIVVAGVGCIAVACGMTIAALGSLGAPGSATLGACGLADLPVGATDATTLATPAATAVTGGGVASIGTAIIATSGALTCGAGDFVESASAPFTLFFFGVEAPFAGAGAASFASVGVVAV
jgi:hypothetical protein